MRITYTIESAWDSIKKLFVVATVCRENGPENEHNNVCDLNGIDFRVSFQVIYTFARGVWEVLVSDGSLVIFKGVIKENHHIATYHAC